MRKRCESPLILLIGLGATMPGCWQEAKPPEPAPPSFKGITLKVGALDDPALLTGVISQRGEWMASRGGELSIVEPTVAPESAGDVDVLLFPGDRIGDLVDDERLEVIPDEALTPPPPPVVASGEAPPPPDEGTKSAAATFQYLDIAPPFRDQVARYGSEGLALPYGGSALVLAYRRDAFERDANRAAASEKGLTLEPPGTWGQLDALARFFQGRDWDGDGDADHGIALVLGPDAEDLGNATFLARSASLGQHPDQFSFLFDSGSMAPRVDMEPFVEALGGLIALKAAGPPGVETFDAEAARKAFRSGKVAMLIDRAERAATWSHGKPVGVAPLPGSERVFNPSSRTWVTPDRGNRPSYLPRGGGWLVGVRRGLSTAQRDAAVDFVRYLADPENSNRTRAERAFPMLPFRSSQMGQGLPDPTAAPDVDSRLWSDAVGRTFAERPVLGLRIPGAARYHDELAKGRAAALAGKSPRQALEDVARAWAGLTGTLGPQHQLWHYRRSLNLRGTAPRPPQRGT